MRTFKNAAVFACAVCMPLSPLFGHTAPQPMPPVMAPVMDPQAAESTRLHALFDEYYQKTVESSPEYATVLGEAGYDHLWSELTHEACEKGRRLQRATLKKLQAIDRTHLSYDDQLNASILEWHLKNQVAWARFQNELMPLTQQHGPHLEVSFLLQIMPFETVQNYENALARLRAVPKLLQQATAMMNEGVKEGITPPKVTLEGVPESILKQLPENPEESSYFKPFAKFPESFSEEDRARLSKEAREAIAAHVYPAMRSFHDYVVKSYLPRCRQTTGMKDLPHGRAWYRQAVRSYTTTELSPDEIHQKGLSEVRRLKGEMRKVIAETGFKGDLKAFFHFMRTDPQFTFAKREDLVEEYNRLLKIIEGKLPEIFGRLPKSPCLVQPVPEHSEKTAPGAYYLMGSPKTGRPGIFFANTYDLKARPKWETEPLALHEALPGHHMQLSIALENESIPKFRMLCDATSYIEGWGLYSEGLGKELGLYNDPYARFGGISHELFRAARLVVDTGVHYKGWSRQKAIDYFLENTCLPEHDVISEVNRYIVRPGQALAYKIGQLHILKLRQEAKMALGQRFDIRAFHDALLEQGDMPLGILDAHMHKWMSGQMGK